MISGKSSGRASENGVPFKGEFMVCELRDRVSIVPTHISILEMWGTRHPVLGFAKTYRQRSELRR